MIFLDFPAFRPTDMSRRFKFRLWRPDPWYRLYEIRQVPVIGIHLVIGYLEGLVVSARRDLLVYQCGLVLVCSQRGPGGIMH